MPQHDIILIGASVGGITAVKTIAAALPEDLPAAVFVVIHTTEDNPGRPCPVESRQQYTGSLCYR